MPVLPLAIPQFTIGDLANEVIPKCENRTTDYARACIWVRDALIEISANAELRGEFDELEQDGLPFNLTVGTSEYEFIGNFVAEETPALAGLDILLWQDPPTNVQRKRLPYKHYQYADSFQGTATRSLPQFWYRFGTRIGFYPPPDKAYAVLAHLYVLHPIVDADLKSTYIQLSRDWHEVIVMAALERGWIELEEYEKATATHQLLFGDPKDPSRPGLIYYAKNRKQREAWRQEGRLRPVVQSYSRR